MMTTNYKEAHRVSDADNTWLLWYDIQYREGANTKTDDRKYESLGDKYTDNPDWYYQWDRYENHVVVVVD